MGQVMIEITKGEASFQPDPAQVTTQDNVFWVNNTGEEHWPTRTDGKGPDQIWMKNQIPPEASSSGVAFFAQDVITGKQLPYTVEYFCAAHPFRANERGKIQVTE